MAQGMDVNKQLFLYNCNKWVIYSLVTVRGEDKYITIKQVTFRTYNQREVAAIKHKIPLLILSQPHLNPMPYLPLNQTKAYMVFIITQVD